MKQYRVIIFLLTLYVISGHAATQPKFSIKATTATAITIPANRHGYIQYTVTNHTTITRTLTMKPIPHVIQRTGEDEQCGNPFTLAQNQSCTLTLYIDGASLKSKYVGGPIICKTQKNSNTPDPFLCSQPESDMTLSIEPAVAIEPTEHKLYVSNWTGNSISLCYVETSGTLKYCLASAVSSTFINPEALAIGGSYLFIANIGGGMSSCEIAQGTGELSNCISAINDQHVPIYAPDGISIVGSTAYIANSGPLGTEQGVTVCTVSGANLINCSFTQGDASFSVPSDLAALNGTIYITNFNSQDLQTTYCTIAPSLCTTGSGEGMISGASGLLNEPEGLFFTTIQSTNYAYFTNHGNNTVTLCEVQSPNNFINCVNTQGYFAGFGNLAVLNSTLKAFIPSGTKSIDICDVNGADASLSNCVTSSEANFNSPSGVVIQ